MRIYFFETMNIAQKYIFYIFFHISSQIYGILYSLKTLCYPLMGMILLSACTTVGPDYVPPEVDIPKNWQTSLDIPDAIEDLESGWEKFKDPSLSQLIEIASRNSPDLQLSREKLQEAFYILQFTHSKDLPNASLFVNGNAKEDSQGLNPLAQENVYGAYSAGLRFSWEIDLWGGGKRTEEMADGIYASEKALYLSTMVLLYSEIASHYVALRTLEKRLSSNNQHIELQKKTLTIVNHRIASNLSPLLDRFQALQNLESSQATLQTLKKEIDKTKNILAVLVGIYPREMKPILSSYQNIPKLDDIPAISLPKDVIRQRPDIVRAERLLAAQVAGIGIEEAKLYPLFAFNGNFGFASTDLFDLFSLSNKMLTAGIASIFRLFPTNNLRTNMQINAQKSRADQALIQYKKSILTAVQEVETALSSFKHEQKRAHHLEKTVHYSQESLKRVKKLYTNGLTDFQNVLDTERNLLLQQDHFIQSEGLTAQYMIAIYRSIGGSWKAPMDLHIEKNPSQPTAVPPSSKGEEE